MISVGIDIGDSSVKLAEVHATSKSYSIVRFQEFPLSTDPNKDKKIEILDILRQIAGNYDPESTRFVMAIHQNYVALRMRQFPFKERFKILRSIAFELEDDIPFSQDDAVFDAKVTRYVENSADVLAVACPKEYIRELLSLAREAGLEPDILTVEGIALGKLLENWQQPPLQQEALAPTPEARPAEFILDIGHTRSLLVMASGGSLIGARNIDWGGKQIAEVISQRYNIHYLEALKELQKKAFVLLSHEGATRDQVAFSEVIKQGLEPLIQEVKFSLLETATARNVKFTSAHICGGVSQIKNLGPFLTQAWEVSVNRLRHFNQHPQATIDTSPSVEATSPMAIAVALEALRRPRNPATNLLTGEFAKRAETVKVFWERWGYAAKIASAAFVILLVHGFMREMFATDMNDQSLTVLTEQAGVIADLKGRDATPRRIRNFVKRKKEDIAGRKIAAQVKKLSSALDVVADVSKSAPNSKQMLVEIRKFIVDNETVEVHGESPLADAIAKFRQSLGGVASDGKVDQITPTITPEAGKLAFGFRLRVNRQHGD